MAVCRVSTTAEIVSRLGTLPVATLRISAVSQVAIRPASRPTSRPYSQAPRAAAPIGRPADSVRLQSAVRSSSSGRGSSRCSRMAESLSGRGGGACRNLESHNESLHPGASSRCWLGCNGWNTCYSAGCRWPQLPLGQPYSVKPRPRPGARPATRVPRHETPGPRGARARGMSVGGTTLVPGGTGRLAVAGDRRAAGALDGTGAAGAPPGRGAAGAPGRPWSRYDDARTAVVRDILRTVISAL